MVPCPLHEAMATSEPCLSYRSFEFQKDRCKTTFTFELTTWLVQVGTVALVNWNEFVKRTLPNERKAVLKLWASVWSGLLSSMKVFPKYLSLEWTKLVRMLEQSFLSIGSVALSEDLNSWDAEMSKLGSCVWWIWATIPWVSGSRLPWVHLGLGVSRPSFSSPASAVQCSSHHVWNMVKGLSILSFL